MRKLYPVTAEDVVRYLRSRGFKGLLGQGIKRVRLMEQGFLIAYSPDRKFHTVWDKEVGEDFTRSDWTKIESNRWLPIGWIQLHPLSDFTGQYMDQIPSQSDLLHISNDTANWVNGQEMRRVGMFGGLIVPGRIPIGWAWNAIPLSEQQVKRIYAAWQNSLSGVRYNYGEEFITQPITYQDIDELHLDLRSAGVVINKKELRHDIADSFASLVKDLHVKFGFLE